MNRAAVGVALLSGSWLIGLGYYEPADLWAWAALVAIAPALLTRVPLPMPGPRAQIAAICLCLPAIGLMPPPHKAIPLLLAAGLGLQTLPGAIRWPRHWGRGATAASLVLLAQSLTVWLYEIGTARRHELPEPLAHLALLAAQWLGLDATVDRGCLVIRCVQENTPISATWDLLLDPASLCFFVGGCVVAGLAAAAAMSPSASGQEGLRATDSAGSETRAERGAGRGEAGLETQAGRGETRAQRGGSRAEREGKSDRRSGLSPGSRSRPKGGSATRSEQPAKAWQALAASWTGLLLITAAWAPCRAALLVSVVLHRALRADALTAPNVGSVLVNHWVHLALLAGLVLLTLRFARWPGSVAADRDPLGESGKATHRSPTEARASLPSSERVGAPAIRVPAERLPGIDAAPGGGLTAALRTLPGPLLVAVGAALLVGAIAWVPTGSARGGRVMVVERHSTWEPTTVPYGTTVYGEAGSYNYAAAYAYCGQYFAMSRLLPSERIDVETLRRCDVLVVKTPTERYANDEVRAIVRFVQEGGSLLLVGDHTNVFNMSTFLNDIARPFGFTFRNDLLFRVGDPYRQPYSPPLLAHPCVQYVPPMYFAVSCSIDPGRSGGAMPIRGRGLWSLPPAYHESNYHPQAEYRPRMQYGAWCQLWATTSGRGRVLAFADSTLFSNFCLFQPGKAELLRGMLDWLNHRSVLDRPVPRATLVSICVAAAIFLAAVGAWRSSPANWLVLAAAALAGWSAAAVTVRAAHARALPVPVNERPLPHVVIDRTVSEVPLFTGAFTDGEEGVGYGMLEQWIPRLGSRLSRASGEAAFGGDSLVIIGPTRSLSPADRQRLLDFVASGKDLLVLDAADLEGSTANGLLWPFGLSSRHGMPTQENARLRCVFPAPEVALADACEISGGEPIAWLGDSPVAAQVRYGKGTVTAVGFAALFNDENMGFHWLAEPEPAVRERYEVLYGLLRRALPAALRDSLQEQRDGGKSSAD